MFTSRSKEFKVNRDVVRVWVSQLFNQGVIPGKYFVMVNFNRGIPLEGRSFSAKKNPDRIVKLDKNLDIVLEAYEKTCAEYQGKQGS